MREKLRTERALVYALVPIPYIAAMLILSAATNAVDQYLHSNGLLWQCLGALSLTLFVLGPPCFIGTGLACLYHAVRKLRRRESVRLNAVLVFIALVTIGLTAAWFRGYWSSML